MLLISLLIAIAIRQFWKCTSFTQCDLWLITADKHLTRWLKKIDIQDTTVNFAIVISVMAIVVFTLSSMLHSNYTLLYGVFSCAILVYSFGRSEVTGHITNFIVAQAKGDWNQACRYAQQLNVDTNTLTEGNWHKLNRTLLSQANYQGFEQFFAVVFWFFLLGPVGAISYRLTQVWANQISIHNKECSNTKTAREFQRLIAFIDWPAIRVLGLSYAVTGNFIGCINAWKSAVTDRKLSNKEVLFKSLEGALFIDEAITHTKQITRKELEALQQIQTRTLWLWVTVIALAFIV